MDRRRFLQNTGRAGMGLAALPTLASGVPGLHSSESKAHNLRFPLNQGWQIAMDADNRGVKAAWFRDPPPNSVRVDIPSTLQQVYPGYHGVCWYFLEFEAADNPWKNGRSILRFAAVDYFSEAWLNGTAVGSHEGGDTPFALDVTGAFRAGTNHLAVRVVNPTDEPIDGMLLAETPHRNKFMHYTNGALPDFGGMIGEVELTFRPALQLSDIFIQPDWKTGDIVVEASFVNHFATATEAVLSLVIESHSGGTELYLSRALSVAPGASSTRVNTRLQNFHVWDLDNPVLYTAQLRVGSTALDGDDIAMTSFGFRDFRLHDGFFHLNGRRIFLRCTHTGNHVPFGQCIPPASHKDMLRQDLLYAKASGFNAVRFIDGLAYPYQLDLCDQIGLLVYEESSASWLLKGSAKMKERYERAVTAMILRDRNHPSVALWGLLNETEDGPVFREAVDALPLVRSLDETRLVLLSSGRFDGHLDVGSASNPKLKVWEHVWGEERPGAERVPMKEPSGAGIGDFHFYPTVPQTDATNRFLRTLGEGSKPVFLSEYGVGSLMNVIHETKMYEQAGIRNDAEDFVYMRSMAERLLADWERLEMEAAYPSAERMLEEGQRRMARYRLQGFDLIRANPQICGFNLTGMLDHAYTGEGVWRFWRDWKPEAFDATRNGWAAVRWCLFANPKHSYRGTPITLEAVLANECVIPAGEYPAEFRVWGAKGTHWKRQGEILIGSEDNSEPFARRVFKEEVRLDEAVGWHEFVPSTPKGIATPETSCRFYISDRNTLPKLDISVLGWGLDDKTLAWLGAHGVRSSPFTGQTPSARTAIVVGDPPASSTAQDWQALARVMASGAAVLFLSPRAFKKGKEEAAWLPLAKKGRVHEMHDWLYHKECVAKPHRIFEGLEARGILDWDYYGPMLPSYIFDSQQTPDETMAAAFAAGYSTPGGYACGVLLGSYNFFEGNFFVNAFPVLDHLDAHPVADRLLLNLIAEANSACKATLKGLPAGFADRLKEIGYVD